MDLEQERQRFVEITHARTQRAARGAFGHW
jgi:hypothetical protein